MARHVFAVIGIGCLVAACASEPIVTQPISVQAHAPTHSAMQSGGPQPNRTVEGCDETPGCSPNSGVGRLYDGDLSLSLNESNLPDHHPGADDIWLGFTSDDCYLWHGQASLGFALDQDQDGLSDYCELQLAKAFAPLLSFSAGETCGGGEGYWAAKAIDSYFTGTPEQVKLGYLTAYYDDCGSFGHYGDSEFIQLTIEYNPATQHWNVIGGWLSAHSCMDNSLECLAGTSATNNTSYGAGFEYPSGRALSFPRVYVSKNKHANYHTASDCDAGGAFGTDTCQGHSDLGRFKVWQDHNVGSGHHPLIDCTRSQSGNPGLAGTECFWTGGQFAGWHSNVSGTAGYSGELLSLVAFQGTMVTYNWWWAGSYGY